MIYKKLSEISINNKGYYGIGASSCEKKDDLPQYLRITDISDDGRIPSILPTCIDKNEYSDYGNYILNKGDLLLARTGNSTGRNHLYKKDDKNTVFAGFLIKFSLNDKLINPYYVGYYCQSKNYYNQIDAMITGSTRPNINAEQYGDLLIPICDLSTQQHIVDSIGSVDDAIEKNEEIIEKIKVYGNKLFNTIDTSKCIDASSLISFEKGIEIGSSNYYDKEIDNSTPYIRVGNLLNNNYDTYCIDNEYKRCDYDDILIAFDGAPGRNSIGLCGVYSSGIYKVICDSKLKGFVYFYINSNLCQDIIKQNSQGTTILHASKSIKLLKMPCVDNIVLDNQLNNLYNMLICLYKKQIKFKKIKQLLLNKYFD